MFLLFFLDADGDDDFFEEDDMFSRIEETREMLERELGCDTFLQAYKTVQVNSLPQLNINSI